MKQIVFLLEEKSMKEVLSHVLPQLLPPDISFLLIAHEGKSDLEASIPRKFRNPDLLGNAFSELKQLIVTYQTVGGARAVAPHLNLRENHSPSFRNFISGIERLCTTFTDS
jgi:hypothetical protein